MLCRDGVYWSDFVVDGLSLPLTFNMFHPGKSGSVIFNEHSLIQWYWPLGWSVEFRPVGLLSTRDVD